MGCPTSSMRRMALSLRAGGKEFWSFMERWLSFDGRRHPITFRLMDPAPQAIRTFFVTANTANRRRLFQVSSNVKLLLDLIREDRARGRYQVHAYVVMPDHIHLLLTPAPNVSLEKAMQFIKGGFSFRLRSKMKVWQESFRWEGMKDARDYEAHRDYIQANPVRKNLCERAEDFEHSSAGGSAVVDLAPEHLRA
jgi:putative transposase